MLFSVRVINMKFLTLLIFSSTKYLFLQAAKKPRKEGYQPYVAMTKDHTYILPTEVEIDNNTKEKIFKRDGYSKTVYFCPSQTAYSSNCLREKSPQSLKSGCDRIPKPVILLLQDVQIDSSKIVVQINCTSLENTQLYGFVFLMCELKDSKSMNGQLVYAFCYNHLNKKISYTWHTIESPLLIRDQEKLGELAQSQTHEIDVSDHEGNTYISNLSVIFENLKQEMKKVSKNSIKHKMVPSEHMAFGSWKDTTNHITNFQIMPKKLSLIWTHIDKFLEQLAIKRNIRLDIFMAKFSFSKRIIWHKIVYDRESKKGVVIRVHEELITEKCYDEVETIKCEFSQPKSSWDKLEKNLISCCPLTYYYENLFNVKLKVESNLLSDKN